MKILVCTDGSKLSDKAVKKAAKAAALIEDTEVTVIHVHQPIHIPPPYGAGYAPVATPSRLNEQIKEEGKKILEGAASTLAENGVKFNTFLLDGHVPSKITDYAAEHRFDLLVIGSKGRTGLEKVLMGSVSSTVVQEVDCDVLVVK